jgi:hypothetical protein
MKSIINLYIAIYFIINCFNILFGQEEKLNSSSDSVFVENLLMTDSLKTDSDSLSLESSLAADSLKTNSDSLSLESSLAADSLKTDSDSLSLETDSTGMEINEITPLKANLNKIKILLKRPKVQKALIGAGIVIPIIYIISNNDKEIYKKESVGSPPQWPD